MSNVLNAIEKQQLREIPVFEVGNTVKIDYKIKEGDKERVQPFEGVVISRHFGDKNIKASFTVRKVSQGHGIERVFPLHSPRIENITVLKKGKVKRAKLYFLRERKGKSAKLKDKMIVK